MNKSYRSAPGGKWTVEQAEKLRSGVQSGLSFKQLADIIGKPISCCYRKWHYAENPSIKRGSWSLLEDRLLTRAVNELGEHSWVAIAERVGTGRTSVQCRKRWMYCLKDSVELSDGRRVHLNRGRWSNEEVQQLLEGYEKHGPNWKLLASEYVVTRTLKQCQQKWNDMKQSRRGNL
jgi:hypothetical protein